MQPAADGVARDVQPRLAQLAAPLHHLHEVVVHLERLLELALHDVALAQHVHRLDAAVDLQRLLLELLHERDQLLRRLRQLELIDQGVDCVERALRVRVEAHVR